MSETWVPLWGTDTDYLVSDQGKVASCRPKTMKENGGKPHVMSPQKWRTGYRFVKCHGVIYSLHHIVYFSFNDGTPPTKKDNVEVNHLDGDKTNNALSNLELVSRKRNRQHAVYEMRKHAWGNPAIETTVTVKATGEVITFPSRRAMSRSFKLSEVQVHE